MKPPAVERAELTPGRARRIVSQYDRTHPSFAEAAQVQDVLADSRVLGSPAQELVAERIAGITGPIPARLEIAALVVQVERIVLAELRNRARGMEADPRPTTLQAVPNSRESVPMPRRTALVG